MRGVQPRRVRDPLRAGGEKAGFISLFDRNAALGFFFARQRHASIYLVVLIFGRAAAPSIVRAQHMHQGRGRQT